MIKGRYKALILFFFAAATILRPAQISLAEEDASGNAPSAGYSITDATAPHEEPADIKANDGQPSDALAAEVYAETPARFWENRKAAGWLFPIPDDTPWALLSAGGFGNARAGNRTHAGFDISTDIGAEIIAIEGGTVVEVLANFYGRTSSVAVQHTDGSVARYCEIRLSPVSLGDTVQQGTVLGTVIANSIGGDVMLHFEVYYGKDLNGNLIDGLLTDRSNKNYLYVENDNYCRRKDLLDPSGIITLASTPPLTGVILGRAPNSHSSGASDSYEGLGDDFDYSQSAAPLQVDGVAVSMDAYNFEGANYFKIRDLAHALSGTEKQFDVGWDNDRKAVLLVTGRPYKDAGGEATHINAEAIKPALTTAAIILRGGKEVFLTAFNIDGNNFFRLRDIAELFDFGVDWDTGTNSVKIDTSKGYAAPVY